MNNATSDNFFSLVCVNFCVLLLTLQSSREKMLPEHFGENRGTFQYENFGSFFTENFSLFSRGGEFASPGVLGEPLSPSLL